MMKLLESQCREYPNDYLNTWLADDMSELTPDFSPESGTGSMIIVIENKAVFIKNNAGKWQKFGTAEVV